MHTYTDDHEYTIPSGRTERFTMVVKQPPEIKERYLFRIEPSLIERCDAVAETRFGGNRSLVVRKAIERFVEDVERELDGAQTGRAA